MCTVYFLRSQKNNKIYVGVTGKDVIDRLKEHNSGTNAFTRKNRPFELVYYESYHCKKDAFAREKFYKSRFGRKIRDGIIEVIEKDG